MLEELGVPYELVESATPWSPAVKEHHRSGKVPVLLVGSAEEGEEPFVLTESLAINTFLGDQYLLRGGDSDYQEKTFARENAGCDGPALTMPKFRTRDRARYNETICCILSELDSSLWIHQKHTDGNLSKYFGSVPDITAPCAANFHRVNALLASRCRPYLLGQNFTPADIAYVHCLDWARREEWDRSDKWPADALNEYLELCQRRPAYQRANRIRAESRAPSRAPKI
jgi:glutathione S-transferase